MAKFNKGKPYHGSDDVSTGKLHGATGETDYFYFFCPKCPDKRILRILDYGKHGTTDEFPYNDKVTKKAERAFALVFSLYCEKCKFTDFVKIANYHWQGGKYADIMHRVSTE